MEQCNGFGWQFDQLEKQFRVTRSDVDRPQLGIRPGTTVRRHDTLAGEENALAIGRHSRVAVIRRRDAERADDSVSVGERQNTATAPGAAAFRNEDERASL